MPSHEEGEFELVLGNKQLLSVFFLVILLLGVFFSMGYIVGRNTAPATSVSAGNRQPPIMVEPAGRGTPLPDPTKPSALTPDPKGEPPKPVHVTKAEPPKVELPKVEPPKVQPPKVEPAKPKPVEPVKTEPVKPAATATGGGSYLQVVATRRPDADKVVAALTGKGFPAKITPVPDSTLVRVVVGPLAENVISRTRSGLEAEGYKPILRKF
jgi:cell division protein FtsN